MAKAKRATMDRIAAMGGCRWERLIRLKEWRVERNVGDALEGRAREFV